MGCTFFFPRLLITRCGRTQLPIAHGKEKMPVSSLQVNDLSKCKAKIVSMNRMNCVTDNISDRLNLHRKEICPMTEIRPSDFPRPPAWKSSNSNDRLQIIISASPLVQQ